MKLKKEKLNKAARKKNHKRRQKIKRAQRIQEANDQRALTTMQIHRMREAAIMAGKSDPLESMGATAQEFVRQLNSEVE